MADFDRLWLPLIGTKLKEEEEEKASYRVTKETI